MLFDAPYPLRLTPFGRWVLAIWAADLGVFLILVITAWLR